jgi:uncharacterized membrane protein (UPF0182 family)
MFATYHMTNPVVFYNKEDQWELPTIDDDKEPMQPYYTIMRLPGETKAEFIQMVPLNPRRKDNLAAWIVAESDAPHYGRLIVFRFPKQKVVFGPRQVVARINQDQVISPQITLWNQQGSEVIQGTLLVIPIEESLLYIRPMYLRAATSCPTGGQMMARAPTCCGCSQGVLPSRSWPHRRAPRSCSCRTRGAAASAAT